VPVQVKGEGLKKYTSYTVFYCQSPLNILKMSDVPESLSVEESEALALAANEAPSHPIVDRQSSIVNRIAVLPPDVVARIAAGEVVERPASIVKELAENALDAGATRIAVEILQGGRGSVRVSDDGRGMPPADLALCVLAHATSKLRHAADLDALNTLGFRGEALPSIAAVSRFSIVSRPRSSEHTDGSAWKIEMEGGHPSQPQVRPAAGPYGTTVEARELFFNTPVRSKFLKASASEAAACADTLLRLALTRPDTAFSLKQERHEIFNLPAACSPAAEGHSLPPAAYLRRAREALGRDSSRNMVEIALEGPGADARNADGETQKAESSESHADAAYRLYGLISPPSDSRPNRNHIYLSVNGRTVRDRMLTSALLEACRHLLPPRRYPAAVLFLDVPAADVDVNVHPTKAEVRFRIPGLIYALLHRAVRTAFGLDGSATPDTPPATVSLWPKAATPVIPRFAPDEQLFAVPHENGTPNAAESERRTAPAIRPVHPVVAYATRAAEAATPFTRSPSTLPQPPLSAPAAPATPRSFRVLAQAGGMYIVLEDATGVKLIDQHALHERVLFETFLERAHGRARGDAQGLLIPETLDLSPAQTAAYHDSENASELLTNLGFDVEAFGPRALIVRAVPAILKTLQAATFVRDVLDAIAAPDESAPRNSPLRRGHFRERAAYMLSCKGAIKAGERLTIDQMTALMDEFHKRAGHGPLTCPHGRPLAIEMSWDDLERGVGRK